MQPHTLEHIRIAPVLTAQHVTKRFGSTQALTDTSLEMRSGEVLGLLGANGAGKSTLSRIVSGHLRPTSGTLTFDGCVLELGSTRDALRVGIALVAQETFLAPDMSVLENIFLPDLATSGHLSYRDMRRKATEILEALGHNHILPLKAEVRTLSAAQRQLVEIAKALALDARLVIFDEPTASLSTAAVDRLFDIMTRLREDGRALGFVSHRLEEVFAITDRVTIMREGRIVLENAVTGSLSQNDIIRYMVGRDIGTIYSKREVKTDGTREVVFEVRGLRSMPWVKDISFSVRRGEILGLGGLVGAGRSEAVEAVWGLRPKQAGEILINGKLAKIKKPVDAVRAGLGFVAEDRRAQNIVPDFNVHENLMIAQMGKTRSFGRGYSNKEMRVRELFKDLDLPMDRMDQSLLNFSGGMQQKVIIARWLLIEPDILILDEPTKGVDIGTRSSVYRLLQAAADEGLGVIVISSDFEELIGLAERIVVVSDGSSIADLPAEGLSEDKLTLIAAPRTSTARNQALLSSLVNTYGGEAFWCLLDKEQAICLARAGADLTGMDSGQALKKDETFIPNAIRCCDDTFVGGDGLQTLLTQMTDTRGHDLGWIGLTLPEGGELPEPSLIRAQIMHLNNENMAEIS